MIKTTLVLLLVLTIGASYLLFGQDQIPTFTKTQLYTDGFSHPADLKIIDDEVWLSQFQDTVIHTFSDFSKPKLTALAAQVKDGLTQDIKSPHFLAATNGGVFISEGRGSQVRFFSFDKNIMGEPLLPEELSINRPHGLCYDNDKWLYIADSANSRLLRVNPKTNTYEVFKDLERKIAYGRQLLCRSDGIWLSNSYEGAFTLNPGTGSNVLRISDFSSGLTETVVAYPDTNTTGIAIIDDRLLLVGRWVGKRDIVMFDLKENLELGILHESDPELDTPYGMFVDEENKRLYVAFLGIHPNRSPGSAGGIVEYQY